jgi:hypothetical protein
VPSPNSTAGNGTQVETFVPPTGTWRKRSCVQPSESGALEAEWLATRISIARLEEERARIKPEIRHGLPLGRDQYVHLVVVTELTSQELDHLATWAHLWPATWESLHTEHDDFIKRRDRSRRWLTESVRAEAQADATARFQELGLEPAPAALWPTPRPRTESADRQGWVARRPRFALFSGDPVLTFRRLSPTITVAAVFAVATLMIPAFQESPSQLTGVHPSHAPKSPATAQLVPRLRWRGSPAVAHTGSGESEQKSSGGSDNTQLASQSQPPAQPSTATVTPPAPAPAPAPVPASPPTSSSSGEFGFEQ